MPKSRRNRKRSKPNTVVAPPPPPPSYEDCEICYESFDGNNKTEWKQLFCGHKVCTNCYKKINIEGKTMSGVTHTSVKCPFCQISTGVIVGICPNGTMKVRTLQSPCAGYENCGSIEIHYYINDDNYYLNRLAYLPNNEEGLQILKLLEIAWDRRVSFTIGTSVTTGVENTVVWNIHHKTNQTGGVGYFGYPDATYFQRVKWELEAYGIGLDSVRE